MREAKERGTDIERSCEGLPMNMLMPQAYTRPEKFSSSSTHCYEPGTVEVRNPYSDYEILKIASLSTIAVYEPRESPPCELLTELAVDGVNPPVSTIPDETRTSHGQFPTLNGTEDIEAFPFRRAESPDHPQVPCDESPSIQHGSAECEPFNTYYKEPASVFLNYFHLLERVPDPAMPTPSTEWPDWPKSPSTPGQNPIAKPTQTDTNPVVMPKRE